MGIDQVQRALGEGAELTSRDGYVEKHSIAVFAYRGLLD